MRVSCLQENLAKGLSIVGRAVASRSTLPVLGNILLEARDNQLKLAATNFEITISCWIGAKVEDEGAITVPARLLGEFVNSLPSGQIKMELEVRTQTLALQCARYNATLKGIDAADFPIIPTAAASAAPDGAMAAESHADGNEERLVEFLEGTNIELEVDGLRKMIDQVIFAASTDDSRPTLTGVEVCFKGDRLAMAATDGYRLSLRSVRLEQAQLESDLTVIVPARSLGELARIAADADAESPVRVVVTEARNQILFQLTGKSVDAKGGGFHSVELVSQLIDARFPDYSAIIPQGYETRTVVDTAELLKAARVSYLFARENANIIRLAVIPNGGNSGQMRLTATSADMGDSVNEIDVMVEGSGLEIAFNAKYLIDVLSQIDQPQIVLETSEATRPGTLRPVGMGEDEFLHVVMPMHPPK